MPQYPIYHFILSILFLSIFFQFLDIHTGHGYSKSSSKLIKFPLKKIIISAFESLGHLKKKFLDEIVDLLTLYDPGERISLVQFDQNFDFK